MSSGSVTSIAGRFAAVEERIRAACARAGRQRSDVTLVAASKSQPVAALAAARDAGVRVFGENRVQEAQAKAAELPTDIDWHLLGPLQTNKAKHAAELFSTVHSIDRLKIATALDRHARRLGRRLTVFVEVNLGDEASKHGFAIADVRSAVAELGALGALDLVGLMAIPPFEPDPEASRPWFRRLRGLRDEIAASGGFGPRPGALSMGMSGDFEVAVEEGATHVRVGTALFGPRE